MAHPSDQMHQMNVLREEAIHGTPSNRIDSLPDQDHAFVDRNVPPPDQRPPALGYIPLPEPRPEFSHTYFSEMYSFADRRTERTLNGRTLSLRTMTNTTSMPETVNLDRANTNSPSQRAHSFHAMGAITSSIYPPLRPDGTSEETTTSPRTDRLLPSFHQLSKIADGGTEASDPRKTGLANLSTYAGQGIAQAVTTSYPHFPPSQQSSPSTNPMLLGHPSPTSTRTEGPEAYAHAHPPAPFSGPNTFHSRRKSAGNTRPPSFIPSMTGSSNVTSSSSNDTIGSHQSHRSSDAGGYSTNTTPMESTPSSLDDTPKSSGPPRLQSSTSAPSVSAVFLCDYPGCSAPPFQTQYLLNSHANVHSSSRPHYCPIKGCSRGEGGKGFKRKNEMIRHGLVHDSPGYVCPFCPLREHKYPRPDNLQRHVRVHHVDKDKDDPLLREVLAQRPEGGGRGRRRRGGPA